MITINIAKEYSKTPGGRFIKEGAFSGEDFRIKLLKPKYQQAEAENQQLEVILDGGYGYPPSFLEEAFGGLARELHDSNLLNIKIISEEDPIQIDNVAKYIREALNIK